VSLDIEAIERLAKLATPGPWEAFAGRLIMSDGPMEDPEFERAEDAAYVAAVSPGVVMGLVDEVRSLRLEAEVSRDAGAALVGALAEAHAERDRYRAALEWIENNAREVIRLDCVDPPYWAGDGLRLVARALSEASK